MKREMVKIYYEVRDGKEMERKVDYVQTSDFYMALKEFFDTHGHYLPKVYAMELLRFR